MLVKCLFLLAALLSSLIAPSYAWPVDIVPFYTFNQSPLVQIFGLPAAESGATVPPGRLAALLTLDIASNFGIDRKGNEDIILDGETYRTTLALRYGVLPRVDVGVDIPFIAETGGFLDNGVEGFHDIFKLSQNGRDREPKDRLLYRYNRDGIQRLKIDHANGGLGDVRLLGGIQLYQDPETPSGGVALRGSVKIPTGDSETLHGSGSTDAALWITGTDSYEVGTGNFTLYGAAGGMAMTKGEVLRDQQRELVGFGTIGIGWSPLDWLGLKTQVNLHTPFFRHSSLHELSVTAFQWLFGATFGFWSGLSLDIGVSEDLLVVSSSPDVAFHVALKTMF